MPHHALEIVLTRVPDQTELDAARRKMPLAASHDTTRLMTLVKAKTPDRAAHRLRRRLKDRLPIDVITTHYPDANGQILLNVDLPPAVYTAARRAGQTPERFMELATHRALTEHAALKADRLDRAVNHLLAHTTPAHLLSAVGHALTRLPERPTP